MVENPRTLEEYPLYVPADVAAEIVGVGKNTMYEYLNSADPPPYILVGKKDKRIQTRALPAYMERKQEVVLR